MPTALCFIDKIGFAFYNINFNIIYNMNSSPELKIEGSFDLYIDNNTMRQHSKVKPYAWAAKVLYHEANRFFNFTLYDINVKNNEVLDRGIVRFYYEAKGINLTIAADR